MTVQKLAGYKTLLVNGLTLLGIVLASLTGTITDTGTLQLIVTVQAVVNIILRFLTNGPVGKSPPLVVEEGGKATEVTPAVAAEAAATGDNP